MSSSLVVITGASRGIGLSFVEKYKAAGNTVLAVVRKNTPELAALGVEVVDGVDFGKEGANARVISAIAGRKVSILINNAVSAGVRGVVWRWCICSSRLLWLTLCAGCVGEGEFR